MTPSCPVNEIGSSRRRLSRSWSHFAIIEAADKCDESSLSLPGHDDMDRATAVMTPQSTKLKFATIYDEAIPSPPIKPIRRRSNRTLEDRPPSPPSRRISLESHNESNSGISSLTGKVSSQKIVFNDIPTAPLDHYALGKLVKPKVLGGILRNKISTSPTKVTDRKKMLKHR